MRTLLQLTHQKKKWFVGLFAVLVVLVTSMTVVFAGYESDSDTGSYVGHEFEVFADFRWNLDGAAIDYDGFTSVEALDGYVWDSLRVVPS